MRFLLITSLLWATVLGTAVERAAPTKTFGPVTIFSPPSNYTDPRTLYARTTLLQNGNLLATWENYSPEPPLVYFPIYQSTDDGLTWTHLSNVEDTANHLGLRYQPFLYTLPSQLGKFKAGTVFLAGSSIPTDLSSTHIDLYASYDNGKTWNFISHVAAGGRAIPNNGETPVWEPFLLQYNNRLIVYYSDQRDPYHGQTLVHQVSTDTSLKTWGPIIDDVKYDEYTKRPGMTTIAQIPNGKWIMTYEYGGGPIGNNVSSTYQFPVYYRIASDPTKFFCAEGLPVITNNSTGTGVQPNGSPYVVWSPLGGADGTIAVSSGSDTGIFVNQAGGDRTQWVRLETVAAKAYTRSLKVLSGGRLLIAGGGVLPPATNNKVTVVVMDLSAALKKAGLKG
jgi:hypothetical protein